MIVTAQINFCHENYNISKEKYLYSEVAKIYGMIYKIIKKERETRTSEISV